MAELEAPQALPVYRRRRPGRWLLTLAALLLASALVRSLVTNPRFDWGTVGAWLFSRTVMRGLLATLELTAAAMVIGLVLGIVLALMRLSDNTVARAVSWAYIWLFRGTPLLVQLLFWGFISALRADRLRAVPRRAA